MFGFVVELFGFVVELVEFVVELVELAGFVVWVLFPVVELPEP